MGLSSAYCLRVSPLPASEATPEGGAEQLVICRPGLLFLTVEGSSWEVPQVWEVARPDAPGVHRRRDERRRKMCLGSETKDLTNKNTHVLNKHMCVQKKTHVFFLINVFNKCAPGLVWLRLGLDCANCPFVLIPASTRPNQEHVF